MALTYLRPDLTEGNGRGRFTCIHIHGTAAVLYRQPIDSLQGLCYTCSMPKSTSQEPHDDHDLHGEWSLEAQQALNEFDRTIDLAIAQDDIERKYHRQFRRLVARLEFVPEHEVTALRTEMRDRLVRREEARRGRPAGGNGSGAGS